MPQNESDRIDEFPPDLEQAVESAVGIMAAERLTILVKNASKAYMAGDVWAHKRLKIDIDFDVVQQEALDYVKAYRKEVQAGYTTIKGEKIYWLRDRTKDERKRIVNVIEKGIKEGQSIPDIAKALRSEVDVLESQATRIARTEVARIQNHGAINRFKKYGIEKVKWLVFEPCELCAPFANNVYEIDNLPDEIPVHPACRCALAPVVNN